MAQSREIFGDVDFLLVAGYVAIHFYKDSIKFDLNVCGQEGQDHRDVLLLAETLLQIYFQLHKIPAEIQ